MSACKNCLHKKVCGKYAATGGYVNECEHLIENYTTTEIVYKRLIELFETIPHPQRLYPDLFVDMLIENGVTIQNKTNNRGDLK